VTRCNSVRRFDKKCSSRKVGGRCQVLARLRQALAAKPAIDWGAVDAIRRAIDSGSYKVNADKVAQGLIQSERTLGQLKFSET
jgi:flagellar biosynthesis anti-sigma factor FlgM